MEQEQNINIRAIQHHMYCPRRFALIEINRDWEENTSITVANLMHNNVHSGKHKNSGKHGYSISSVRLYNDALNINGIADCIEFELNKNGDFVDKKGQRCFINIIEYKPTAPKEITDEITPEKMQVFAQKVCADNIFHANCRGFFYYGDIKRRIQIPFQNKYNEYTQKLNEELAEMKEILASGVIPSKRKGQRCSGCSMIDICLNQKPKNQSIKQMILDGIMCDEESS